ncbi:hypothetical protein IEQ34_006856 [Dendrobium chrysotoxum]|uniref:CASP-like protein n=1 Tax=Dendrobium chrysotoxum TaxID=161865 RepID=A0AAV7GQF6_DENCH|nr:hypothetical protein IEQ34_006856 [Dendrobium chrysotoxum]
MTTCEVQIYYSVKGETMALERKLRVGEMVLRLVVLGLGVTAVTLVGSASQVRRFFSLEKKARFTDMKVLVFLVVADGVAAGYSLFQGIYCVVRMMKGSVVSSKGLAWVIFACDQTIVQGFCFLPCYFFVSFHRFTV